MGVRQVDPRTTGLETGRPVRKVGRPVSPFNLWPSLVDTSKVELSYIQCMTMPLGGLAGFLDITVNVPCVKHLISFGNKGKRCSQCVFLLNRVTLWRSPQKKRDKKWSLAHTIMIPKEPPKEQTIQTKKMFPHWNAHRQPCNNVIHFDLSMETTTECNWIECTIFCRRASWPLYDLVGVRTSWYVYHLTSIPSH